MKKYFYYVGSWDFDGAVSKCTDENMSPASILTVDDNIAFQNLVNSADLNFWSGGKRIDFTSGTSHLGGFYWYNTDTNSFTTQDARFKVENRYQYWYTDEPNNYGGDQYCVQIFTNLYSNTWDDVSCSLQKNALCQYNHCSNDQVEQVDSNNDVTCLSFTKAKTVSATDSLLSGEYYASLAWVENNESIARAATAEWSILLFKQYPTRIGYTDDSESSWNPTYKLDGSGYGGDYGLGGTWTEGTQRLVMYN